MKAFDFEYAGRNLCEFGFIICHFGDKGLDTVSNGSQISFNTVSTLGGSKYNLTSTQYEECLTSTIQICKNSCTGDVMEVSSAEFRELTKWLNRKRFLKFKILDEDYIDLYFEASFNISRIEIDGRLYGLELEVVTNRPFALKEPKVINIICEEGKEVYGWEKYQTDPEVAKLGYATSTDENAYPQGKVDENGNIIEGEHTDGYQYISIGQVYKTSINDTSYEEGYIYPQMEITIKKDGDLRIYNAIENRETYIGKCVTGEVITMDYPVIQSSISSHNIQNDFNWTFFRVANTYDNSRNDLVISLPCLIKVKYSPIVKVGL